MFSTHEKLRKKTPQGGIDRENYLSLLVDEFINSKTIDSKLQVLGNLANFSYDPINYNFIRDVGVVDIFLHVLKHKPEERLVHFACTGICNLCVDPLNVEYLLKYDCIELLISVLEDSTHLETILSCLTSLIFMNSPKIEAKLRDSKVLSVVKHLQLHEDKRVANTATIYLTDVCGLP